MDEEQRQAALEALDRLENDALCYRDGYGETRKDAETIRSALKAPPAPVIEGLEAIDNLKDASGKDCRFNEKAILYLKKMINPLSAHSKLQNGEQMDNNYTVLWHILPVMGISSGKRFYAVQKVLYYGLGGQTVTVVDHFESKEDAVRFIEDQPDGKLPSGDVRWWNRSYSNG